MPSTTVTTSFEDLTSHNLNNVSYLRLFPIMIDNDGEYFLNIFRSYSINEELLADSLYFETYEVMEDDWWELISNEKYESVNFWWIPPLANKVINPFEELEVGINLQMLRKAVLPILVREIRDIGNL